MPKAKTAVGEVTNDSFVKTCVTFQQAKRALSGLLNGASAEQCDIVSQSVYDLANKALRQKNSHGALVQAVKNGSRPAFRDAIVTAIRGRQTFTSADVVAGLKRKKLTPQATNLVAYISSTFSAHPHLFTRVDRGVYKLKSRKLVIKTKAKALPATTE